MLAAMRRLLPVLALATVLVSGCGSKSSDEKAATPTATGTQAASAAPAACADVAKPKPKGAQHLKKPTTSLDAGKKWIATVATSCGEFKITLDVKNSPKTASSFAYLARKGFFDKTTFHRIARGFVIQGGDPLGNGTGGPGYSITEAPPSDATYTRGVVAMAKTGAERPGTSGSQFFVVTGEDAGLPADYAVLGKVTSGQDVVDLIGVQPANPPDDGTPTKPIVIDSVTISNG
jgi:peptidyl-prolyl cis-trans isomerase B (cyclophilin B)